jgi:endonuclease-3
METVKARQARMREEYAQLVEYFPHVRSALDFSNPLELTVATTLSAQTTDVAVNKVTPALFARYKTAQEYADARLEDLEDYIHTLGFFRTKAKHLIGLGQVLVRDFGGVVPRTMEELVTLPGVGRKTANVVLSNGFDLPGFPVDTHVIRVSGRLRWQDEWKRANPDPLKIEKQITKVFPPDEWGDLSHRLIFLGRQICHARKPACADCPLVETCPSAFDFDDVRGGIGASASTVR